MCRSPGSLPPCAWDGKAERKSNSSHDGTALAEVTRPEPGRAQGRRGRSPGQVEGVMDDLSPVDDRNDLEGATEGVTSGW